MRFQKPILCPVSLLLPLPEGQSAALSFLSITDAAMLATMYPAMVMMDQASETVNKRQLNAFLYKSCCGHGIPSQQQTSGKMEVMKGCCVQACSP